MNLIELIENYIIYLITECGLSVSLHPVERETLITFSRLMRFNLHDNSYCAYIKSTAAGRKKCLEQQKKVFQKCTELGTDFCGVCHAGVFECVYPILDGETVTGFISVSGYSSDNERVNLADIAGKFGYSVEVLSKCYASLHSFNLDKKRLDTLVLPLVRMLELAYMNEEKQPKDETLITRVCRYIKQNYAQDLTSEDICRKFFCSRSHFSHTFKRETGETVREYLIGIRLGHAKRLLKYSKLTVTEIALSVGFNDANYFSNVFKKRVDISPTAYRKTR